jgi:hypothetical protein
MPDENGNPTAEEIVAQQNAEFGPDPDATGGNRNIVYNARGAATSFSRNQYNVANLSYPDDLFGSNGTANSITANQYGGHYVVFYISVAEDSKLFAEGGKDINGNPVEVVSTNIPPRDRGDIIATGLDTGELSAAIAAQSGVAGLAAAGLNVSGAAQAATAAAINTGGAAITESMAASATRAQKRLKTAIAMHVPNQLQISYSSQWSEEDTAGFAMAQGVGGEIINAITSMGQDSNLGEAAQAAGANLFLSKSPSASAASVATGLAANPKKEQVFKGVDFRTFTFEYQFFPRNAKEASNVQNIIKQFKYHMHPEFKDSRNFVFLYPSEFDIYYYQNGRENLNLHRHTSCVLTNMSVNYTPNGVYTTYENGMPTQINVALTFKELAILTKDKIMDGM